MPCIFSYTPNTPLNNSLLVLYFNKTAANHEETPGSGHVVSSTYSIPVILPQRYPKFERPQMKKERETFAAS